MKKQSLTDEQRDLLVRLLPWTSLVQVELLDRMRELAPLAAAEDPPALREVEVLLRRLEAIQDLKDAEALLGGGS